MVWQAAGAYSNGLAVVWGGLTGWEKEPQSTADGWIVPLSGKASPARMTTSPLRARSGHTAVAHDGRVYIWGGIDAAGALLSDGAAFDPSANVWRKIASAPYGLESPKIVAAGNHIFVGAGRRDANRDNSAVLDYDISADTWNVIELGVRDIASWALIDDAIVTVARQSDGSTLALQRFDRVGKAVHRPVMLESKFPKTDYVGLTALGDGVLVGSSNRESTKIFKVTATGEVAEEVMIAGDEFAPAMRAGSAYPDTTVRDGDLWISLAERDIQVLSVSDPDTGQSWRITDCRTQAVWISLGDRKFLRYGGVPCGGDATTPVGAPLATVDLPS
jgi:hypothetical protein